MLPPGRKTDTDTQSRFKNTFPLLGSPAHSASACRSQCGFEEEVPDSIFGQERDGAAVSPAKIFPAASTQLSKAITSGNLPESPWRSSAGPTEMLIPPPAHPSLPQD